MSTVQLNTRIDSSVKESTSRILEGLGLSFTDAISLYFRQIVFHKGIPFDVKIPNTVTMKAIQDAQDNNDLESFDSVDDLFDDLES